MCSESNVHEQQGELICGAVWLRRTDLRPRPGRLEGGHPDHVPTSWPLDEYSSPQENSTFLFIALQTVYESHWSKGFG